jgi:hypothetical protein
MYKPENPFSSFMDERYERRYGVLRWTLNDGQIVTGVSSPGWSDFIVQFGMLPQDSLVVSTELITATELKSECVSDSRAEIEKRIVQVVGVSGAHPEITIVLGTPIFTDGSKPFNGALVIKAGEVIAQTVKRSGVTDWEKHNFNFDPEVEPAIIPDTNIGVLICSDLAMASVYARPFLDMNYILSRSGHTNLIGTSPVFIHQKARTLAVLSCWGIGSVMNLRDGDSVDEYYRMQLRNTSLQVLRGCNNINEILVVDRVPDVDTSLRPVVTTQPINALFSRK